MFEIDKTSNQMHLDFNCITCPLFSSEHTVRGTHKVELYFMLKDLHVPFKSNSFTLFVFYFPFISNCRFLF